MNSKIKIVFTSSQEWKRNQFKAISKELQEILEIEFDHVPDIPEIQGTCEEVVKDKVLRAYEYLKRPCIVDDESFHIQELGGFPGPYLKDFEKSCKNEGMYKVLSALKSDICFSQVMYGITFNGKDVLVFTGQMQCSSIAPREEKLQGQDYYEVIKSSIFGERRLENVSDEEQTSNKDYFRTKAVSEMTQYFKSNPPKI
mmetsp:Transcript_33464/g.34766  ORF Transcript_33464/g.34766 Transcript_33464/m.34766 type:complete len:199 (+) Transcript_33464:1-597(+)